MSRLIMSLLVVGIALLVLFTTGCSDDPTPTPAPTSTPTAPTNTPTPASTATLATEPTDTPTPPPTDALSLDEYLSVCALLEQDLDDDTTYGTFSVAIGASIERMSPLAPPAEVADWHNKSLEVVKVLKGLVDSQPKDKVIGIELFAIAAELEGLLEALTQVENDLPAEVRSRMVEARCIDDVDIETQPDDHGNTIDDATPIGLGESAIGSLDGGDDKDVFVFHAESGKSYEAELSNSFFAAFGSKTGPLMAVYDSAGQEIARIEEDSVRKAVKWTAEDTGNYYVVLGDGASSGSYSLAVSTVAVPMIPTPETLSTATPTPTPTDASPDRAVLEALYNATDGPNWSDNTNWLSDAPLGEWYGVYTDANGRVSQLRLPVNQLSGEIPPELGSLSNLAVLHLYRNELSGNIPPELGSLSNLREIFLRGNQLSGCIPTELRDVPDSDLNQLGLQFCDTATATPEDRAALLALYNATDGPNWSDNTNWLSDRPLGDWYGVTTDDEGRVIWLMLGGNQLSGEIPPELGSLANLETLELPDNQLSGEIPSELANLPNLDWIFLFGNQFIGCVPDGLGDDMGTPPVALQANLPSCDESSGQPTSTPTPETSATTTPVPTPTTDTAGFGGTLQLPIARDPFPTSDFSPYDSVHSGAEAQIHSLLFSRLVRRGASGLEPDLAESWSASADGAEWTVRIKNARFHDGRTVTAADVIASIQARIDRFGGLPDIARDSQIDDLTLSIQFVEPAWDFLEKMSDVTSVIVPKDVLGTPINDFTQLIGSGPFVPVEYLPGVDLELTRNADYYEPDLPRLDRIRVSVILDPTVQFVAFRSGLADYIGYPYSGLLVPDLEVLADSDASLAPHPQVLALWFDTQNPPYDDRNVRLAVLRAIHPEPFQHVLGAGELQSTVPDALFPGWTTAGDEPQSVEEWHSIDLEAAEDLLAQAGYPDGFKTTMPTVPVGWVLHEAAQLLSDLLASVGISVELDTESFTTWADYRSTPAKMGMKLDLVRASTDDVEGFLRDHFAAGGRYNHSSTDIAIPDLDPSQPESVAPVQDLLAEEIYYIPLHTPQFARSGRAKGPITVYDLYDIGWTLREVWVE